MLEEGIARLRNEHLVAWIAEQLEQVAVRLAGARGEHYLFRGHGFASVLPARRNGLSGSQRTERLRIVGERFRPRQQLQPIRPKTEPDSRRIRRSEIEQRATCTNQLGSGSSQLVRLVRELGLLGEHVAEHSTNARTAQAAATIPTFSTKASPNRSHRTSFRDVAPSGTVTRIEHQGREIYLIGTAHVSQNSVDEVKRVIAEVEPDTVCVELDQPRYDSMMDESRWRRLDLFQIIRQKRVLYFISNLALSAYQRKIGESMGVKPGAELLAAVKAAESIGARLVLADRDIQATLKRTWHQLGFWNKSRLVGMLLMIPFAVEEIAAEKIDALRDRDTISEVL